MAKSNENSSRSVLGEVQPECPLEVWMENHRSHAWDIGTRETAPWPRGIMLSSAFVAIGDYNGHVGLGVKCSKEVATAIRGAIILAKLSIVPVRRGYWGNKIGKPHTVPCKVTGRCGSVLVRLIPAPRGTGIVSAPVPKKLLMMAGIDDCYTSARGCTATLGNFAKATFDAISKTYSYLTPDLWKETVFTKSPYQEFTDHLVKTHTRVSMQRTQAPAVATT
ncbi:small ribosomal subunit protein uS5-like [Tenrec ecaudatus]|uniref:small ribosomal subunit protein uS5-like n=1 Tax=Tenrec ecaudatus TaxID=94439 RepID=UPI003F5AB02F